MSFLCCDCCFDVAAAADPEAPAAAAQHHWGDSGAAAEHPAGAGVHGAPGEVASEPPGGVEGELQHHCPSGSDEGFTETRRQPLPLKSNTNT